MGAPLDRLAHAGRTPSWWHGCDVCADVCAASTPDRPWPVCEAGDGGRIKMAKQFMSFVPSERLSAEGSRQDLTTKAGSSTRDACSSNRPGTRAGARPSATPLRTTCPSPPSSVRWRAIPRRRPATLARGSSRRTKSCGPDPPTSLRPTEADPRRPPPCAQLAQPNSHRALTLRTQIERPRCPVFFRAFAIGS